MIGQIYHVGLTVRDMDRSIRFYRDVLGLPFLGEILMEGEATEKMFRKPGCRARVAYLNNASDPKMPPVELIQFLGEDIDLEKPDLFRSSISELCFYTDDAQAVYEKLRANNVECLSKPQEFDFRPDGFGRSRAFYFRDPDGIVLEIMEPLAD